MTSWRDSILKLFAAGASKLTLVADPDGLLSEEKLSMELHSRGFDLLEFSDPVAFRYAYEVNYRSFWDEEVQTDLVVILPLSDPAWDNMPYDLLQIGRKLAFSLGGLFPNLSYLVINKLDRSLLDALYEAQQDTTSTRLGDKATLDFILQRVFHLSVELIRNPTDLLSALFRLHYSSSKMPSVLVDRLVELLQEQEAFQSWPLAEIIPDTEAFLAFLQERWPIFLDSLSSINGAKEDRAAYGLKYPGPVLLPFEHPEIRVFIPKLFAEGKLNPVSQPQLPEGTQAWIISGVQVAGKEDPNERIKHLLELFEGELPTAESRHSEWINFALKWAELAALIYNHPGREWKERFLAGKEAINTTFAEWLNNHYASLISLPPTQPAMVHQIARRLARELESGATDRVALIVVDGLALDQWVSIRKILQEQDKRLVLRESATFAWIPTITAVSRQSIFSGKVPFYFPDSIHTTDKEAKHWVQFWEAAGFAVRDIAYQKSLRDGEPATLLEATLHPGKTRIVGLVIDKVDRIMHGMELGAAGMHNQVKQWSRQGFLASLISYLHDHDFQVWLTSDHGNTEGIGRGRPSEGVIAETRGERVRIYPSPELRASVAQQFPTALKWSPTGLPAKYFPLVAGRNDAFSTLGATIVGHGGISMEEVIVPLVRIERKTR